MYKIVLYIVIIVISVGCVNTSNQKPNEKTNKMKMPNLLQLENYSFPELELEAYKVVLDKIKLGVELIGDGNQEVNVSDTLANFMYFKTMHNFIILHSFASLYINKENKNNCLWVVSNIWLVEDGKYKMLTSHYACKNELPQITDITQIDDTRFTISDNQGGLISFNIKE